MEEMEKIFNMFSKNKDGKICLEDIGKVLVAVGKSPGKTQLQDLLNGVEHGHCDVIDFTVFTKIVEAVTKNHDKVMEEVMDAFRAYDMDGDGFITVDELRAVTEAMGDSITDEELQDMMREADLDGDNRINYAEFTKVWLES